MMKKKDKMIVSILLLISFISGAFSAYFYMSDSNASKSADKVEYIVHQDRFFYVFNQDYKFKDAVWYYDKYSRVSRSILEYQLNLICSDKFEVSDMDRLNNDIVRECGKIVEMGCE